MLIAIDARESGTSTGRYIDKLIEHLAKLDTKHDFNIITHPHRTEFIKKIAPNFFIYETEVKELGFSEQTTLLKELKEIGPDLIHYGMIQQPVLYRGKVVTTMHDLIMTHTEFRNPKTNIFKFKIKQIVYKRIIRMAAKKSSIILTPSKYTMTDVINFTRQPASKFTVTYESADKIKEKADPINYLKNKQFLMYVGRPFPHKNLSRLIQSFVELQAKYPNLYLVLAGKRDINYENIEDNVAERKIKNVVFTDFVTEGELRWLYENCAAYVFPSLNEGFGLPGLEAMAHGAPVVSSNATCLPEIYGDAAKYFNPLDIADMSSAIVEVLNNDQLRKELIEKGYKQASKYSWQKMAEETLEVYERALKLS